MFWSRCIRKSNALYKNQKWQYCEWFKKIFRASCWKMGHFFQTCPSHNSCKIWSKIRTTSTEQSHRKFKILFTKWNKQNYRPVGKSWKRRSMSCIRKWVFISPEIVPCSTHNLGTHGDSIVIVRHVNKAELEWLTELLGHNPDVHKTRYRQEAQPWNWQRPLNFLLERIIRIATKRRYCRYMFLMYLLIHLI